MVCVNSSPMTSAAAKKSAMPSTMPRNDLNPGLMPVSFCSREKYSMTIQRKLYFPPYPLSNLFPVDQPDRPVTRVTCPREARPTRALCRREHLLPRTREPAPGNAPEASQSATTAEPPASRSASSARGSCSPSPRRKTSTPGASHLLDRRPDGVPVRRGWKGLSSPVSLRPGNRPRRERRLQSRRRRAPCHRS